MKVTVDAKKRVRLAPARPGQVFDLEAEGAGRYILTLLWPEKRTEAFPRGSLKRYFTRQRDADEESRLGACTWER